MGRLVNRILGVVAPLLLAGAGLFASAGAAAADLPANAPDKHLGVASCASTVCHGSITGSDATNVLQNEYVTWTQQDKHAGAYQILFNEQSRKIARNLGIGAAHEAKICLDCHAENVPAARRGEKFQVTDGIGCEACHGGSERWLSSHASSSATHAQNVANGMYPTDDIAARGTLCLSCHLGNNDQFATHRIMGAGHPRLSFELDTFGALQPQHYRVDEDYLRRKGSPGSVGTWLAGLVTASKRTLDLVQGPRFASGGVVPEIALFDCHSCHHPMNEERWRPRSVTARLGPGQLRLNDSNLVMLAAATEVLAPGRHKALVDGMSDLHAAVLNDRTSVVRAAARLESAVDQAGAALAGAQINNGTMGRVLSNLFREAQSGEYRDYVAAEQATMAVDLLLIQMGRKDAYKGAVDRLYASVANEHRFDPAGFTTGMAALQRATGL